MVPLAVFLLTPAFVSAQAATAPAVFEEANRLYAQGKFAEASTNYTELIKSGQASAAVYFNLGNAYFKAGQIGRAIAAYRQTEELTPRDPDVQANLKFARNRVQGPTFASPAWHRAIAKLSLDEWTLAASAAAWTWLLLLAIGQWRPTMKPLLKGYILAAGITTLILSSFLAADLYRNRLPLAIVTTTDAVVRQAPLTESDRVFAAPDGAELRVIDRKGEWLQVRPGDNRVGWIRRDQVVMP